MITFIVVVAVICSTCSGIVPFAVAISLRSVRCGVVRCYYVVAVPSLLPLFVVPLRGCFCRYRCCCVTF